MKIKALLKNGEEVLLDTTRDAVAILMSPTERENLSDIAKVKDTMLQLPYNRMNPAKPGSHDLSWWQLWAVRDWGDHIERGKSNDARPFIGPMRAAEAGA